MAAAVTRALSHLKRGGLCVWMATSSGQGLILVSPAGKVVI